MTDKEKIRAEIERLFIKAENGGGSEYFNGAKHTLITLKNFIDHMQENPASEDLEEEINAYLKVSLAVKFPTLDIESIKADVRYIARHFAEWQKQQDIKYGYVTALQGEKRFARFIFEMIGNGWHIEAIKTACNDKINEK